MGGERIVGGEAWAKGRDERASAGSGAGRDAHAPRELDDLHPRRRLVLSGENNPAGFDLLDNLRVHLIPVAMALHNDFNVAVEKLRDRLRAVRLRRCVVVGCAARGAARGGRGVEEA